MEISNYFYGIKRFGLLIFFGVLFALFFYFNLHQYLSFEQLKIHREALIAWREAHFMSALWLFGLIYMASVAISVPGAWFLTLVAGFLFGPTMGAFIVILSATVGAFLAYLAVRFAFRDWFMKRTTQWLKAMEKGFKVDDFSYLLFLRLVPLFPFWLVNIIPALLGVPPRVFLVATFLGIIPGSFIYVLVGNGMGQVFDSHQTPNLEMLADPMVFWPLLGLGVLALVPVIYRHLRR